MEFAFRITGKITLFARKIKHRRPINKEETSQFPYSLFMNIYLNSYLVDFVMNPIHRFTVRNFTFFLQSTPLHGPHRIKFARIEILLNLLKHPSVRPLLVLTLLSLCSSFGALHGQESAPWWKSLFRGTQQRESPDRQLDQTPESESTAPFENTAPALPDSAPMPNNQSSEDANREQEVRPQGSVTFQWDSRVDELELAWKTAAHPLSGFRIQIFSGSLQQAREVRSTIRRNAPKIPVYLSALPPNYRVAIGDYRSKWDAQKDRDDWLEEYPMSIVVPMEINLPDLKKQED